MLRAPPSSADRQAEAQALCRIALHRLHTGQGDAGATVAQALATDPACLRAQCLRAAMLVMSGRQDGADLLAQVLRDAEPHLRSAPVREQRHLAAARAWLEGNLKQALRLYGEIVCIDPHDTLALRVAHLGDLHLGRTAGLRPCAGHACLRPGRERRARAGRSGGARGAAPRTPARHRHALAGACLRDAGPRRRGHRAAAPECVVVVAQSGLRGAPVVAPGVCSISIVARPAWPCSCSKTACCPQPMPRHAMLAFVATGRWRSARRLLDVLRDSAARTHDLERMVLDAALPVCEALLAFGQGRYAETSRRLQALRELASVAAAARRNASCCT